MRGITIRDSDDRNLLSFDLKDILDVLGDEARRSKWLIKEVEASGEEAAYELYRLCDNGIMVDGEVLLTLVHQIIQIIDGVFEAYDNDSATPWIVVYAVDSSAYDVVTEDLGSLEKLRRRFHNVEDMPESAF